MENKILIIDIETTGFINQGGKIVEIGMVELDIKTGETKIVYDSLFNPELPVDELEKSWIVSNGYIESKAILNAPLLLNHKGRIQSIINKYSLGATAYNNKFDFDFLESVGFKIPVKLPCPMILATDICKLPKTGNGAGYGGYKWPNVGEAYSHFFGETDYKELHRGADDAIHEAKIVYELIKLGVFEVNKQKATAIVEIKPTITAPEPTITISKVDATIQQIPQTTELDRVVKTSGLDIKEGEEIKQSYIPFLNDLASVQKESVKINFENPTSLDEKIARELRLRTVKIRTGASDLKDERNKTNLLKQKLEVAAYKLIEASCKLAEDTFVKVEKAREIAEKKRLAERKAIREAKLNELQYDYSFIDIVNMPDEKFDSLIETIERENEIKKENERKELERQQEEIKLNNIGTKRHIKALEFRQFWAGDFDYSYFRNCSESDFNSFMENIIKAKTEYEKQQEEIRIENEKLKAAAIEAERLAEIERKRIADEIAREKAEQAEKERLQRELRQKRNVELRPYIALIRDYEKIISMDQESYEKELKNLETVLQLELEEKAKKAEKQRKEAEEMEKIQAELKAKAEIEAKKQAELLKKEQAEKEKLRLEIMERAAKEKARIDAENKAKEEKEKAEKAALKDPDKEKLKALANLFNTVKMPELKTDDAKLILSKIQLLQSKLVNYINEQSEKL